MRKPVRAPKSPRSKVSFNHAMIYSRDVDAALQFYGGLLGFQVVEKMGEKGHLVYARLRSPKGEGTMALHQIGSGKKLPREASVRLYFEVAGLEPFCEALQKAGVHFSQLPQMMPWGWKHAYLDDPDGHEVSLYWAGRKRLESSLGQR